MASLFVPAGDAAYRKLAGSEKADPFPLVEESTPLVLKREGAACARSVLSRGFCLGVLVTVFAVAGLATMRRSTEMRRQDAPRRRDGARRTRSKYCVAHGAYGDYVDVARISALSKRAYASAHGYAFVELLADDRDGFVASHCPELGSEIVGAYSMTTPVKACGLWAALRDSCDYVFWTDADAVIVDQSLTMETLLGHDAGSGGDSEALVAAPGAALPAVYPAEPDDALLFLNKGCSGYDGLALGDCGPPESFATCINTGALVLKSGSFAEGFLRRQLAMAYFDNDFLQASPCSTAGFTQPEADWDQCMFEHRTEQCTLECLYRVTPTLFNRTRCLLAAEGRDYLSGLLLEDQYQLLAYGAEYTSANFTAFIKGVVGSPLVPPYDGTLVYNCMGGEPAQKVACARAATFSYFPELRATVTALLAGEAPP